jgi:VWFA-related protein
MDFVRALTRDDNPIELFFRWQRNHIVAMGSYFSMSILLVTPSPAFRPRFYLRTPVCRHLLLLLCGMTGLLPLLCTSVSAQDVPATTLRVQSQLVVLDVVVTDKTGNLVTNLSRNDFDVSENGVPQEIRNFDAPRKIDTIPVTAPKDKFGRENWGSAPLTMIVIDEMDTPFEETAFSRQEVDRYLKSQPSLLKQPTIILWLNDAGIHPVTAFSRDRDALITAIDSHKASLADKFSRGAVVEQLSASLSAIQQLALFSRGSKGDKQIIWVGRSFPGIDGTVLDKKQVELMIKAISSTIDLLMQSRTTIYVIDPTVNAAPSPQSINAVGGPNTITADSSPTDPFAKGFNFMSFVEQTGGKYFYGRNDLNNEIEDSIARNTNFYTLSYVPSDPIQDGKYRKIDIRTKNPNLIIQAKQGYYPTQPDQTTVTAKELQFDLHEALVSGMTYNGVGLRLQRCQLGPQGIAACEVAVDNNSLMEEPGPDNSERASIVAVFSALDKHSVLIANSVYKFALKLPDQPAATSYTNLPLHLAVPPNAKTIRVAVRDISGRIGTADLDPSQVKRLVAQHR